MAGVLYSTDNKFLSVQDREYNCDQLSATCTRSPKLEKTCADLQQHIISIILLRVFALTRNYVPW